MITISDKDSINYKLISAGHNDSETFVVNADGSVYIDGDLEVTGSTDLNTGWSIVNDKVTSETGREVRILEDLDIEGDISANNLAWEIDDDIDSLIVTIGNKIVRIGEKSFFDSEPDPDIAPLLSVYGTVAATDLYIFPPGDDGWWPDLVFEKDYNLIPLEELEKKINELGHLPNIPSAKEVSENGLNIVDTQAKLLQKIEELTLYIIELKKEINQLKNK